MAEYRRFSRLTSSLLAGITGFALALSGGISPSFAAEASSGDDTINAQDAGQVLSDSVQAAEGTVSAFIRFKGKGAFDATQPAAVLQGSKAPVDARNQVQAIAAAVEQQGQQVAQEANAEVLYTVHNSMRGVAVRGSAEDIRALANRADVESISPIVSKTPQNGISDLSTGAYNSWVQTGKTGKGIRIAIIDTGIDYTHADFGGPGSTYAYNYASSLTTFPSASSGLYDPAKIVGGYDLVGDNYNPQNSITSTPQPDGNPLDCSVNGHGTHVAGTAAGYGVTNQGKAYKGDFSKLTSSDVTDMQVAPGSAPEAQLIALRAFGCSGPSDVIGLALDRVLDPNGDSDFSDKANIVNLSINTDFGASDDPENAIVNELLKKGILTVAAAGNATANANVGDAYSLVGNPGNAAASLTVANSVTPKDFTAATTTSEDTLRPSSARGQHGSEGYTKPDVAAPGSNIISASVGTGTAGRSMSGTSMAAPHVAGIAALVWQAHRGYTAQQVKSAIMDSAVHEVKSPMGVTLAVDRVGSGRVDALRAVNQDVLLYNAANPAVVSVSFGVPEVQANAPTSKLTRQVTIENKSAQAHTYFLSFNLTDTMPGVSLSTSEKAVTLAPGTKKTITITAAITPSAMEKTSSASNAMLQLGKARQYIADVSGRLTLTENGKVAARIPVHIAPKPVSNLNVSADFSMLKNLNSQVVARIDGTTLNRPGYRSYMGAFELGAISNRMASPQQASLQASDLQYVGAYSNASELIAAGQDGARGKLAIGVSTWGNFSTINPASSIQVLIDTNQDGTADYRLKTTRTAGLDYPVVALYPAQGSSSLATYPLNDFWGDKDTNTMDTNAMVLSVPLADLNLKAGQSKISYKVESQSWYSDQSVFDTTGWISYDPFAPHLKFSGASKVNDVLFDDASGKKFTIKSDGWAYGALFLHLHNQTGDLSGKISSEDGGKAQVQVLNDRTRFSNFTKNPGFRDIKAGDVFSHEIFWTATNAIANGYSDRTFRRFNQVERGAMAAFFYRMAGSPAYTPPAVSRFKDVPTTHQFYKEISWLAEQGITTGFSDGTFRPAENINRDAMAAFFYRFAGSPSFNAPARSPFTDVATNRQFYKEISWLSANKISTGWADGTFHPGEPIRRDAMAAFIYRFMERGLAEM